MFEALEWLFDAAAPVARYIHTGSGTMIRLLLAVVVLGLIIYTVLENQRAPVDEGGRIYGQELEKAEGVEAMLKEQAEARAKETY